MKTGKYAPHGILAVDPKAFGGEFLVIDTEKLSAFDMVGSAAVITIEGPLCHKKSWWLDSYEAILERAKAAFESSASAVILKIDSPGGDAIGCFDLARELRSLSLNSGKELIAFAEGYMCSAAYAIACSANKIYAGEAAIVGSIGVIEGMVDVTAQDAALGMKFAFAMSGDRKADGNPHVPLTKEAFAAVQAQVDALAGLFFGLVEELRGVPSASIAALQARTFLGVEAGAVSLIDNVISWPELVSANFKGEGDKMPSAKKGLTEYLAALAEGDDKEEAAKAKKALAALLAEDSDGDNDGDKKEEPKEAASAEDKKEEPGAVKAEDEKEMSAKAMTEMRASLIAAQREIHTIKAGLSAEKDALVREKIFAGRPDLSVDTVKALASVPTKDLQTVIDTFPRIANPAAASFVVGARGNTQTGKEEIAARPEEAAFIAERMGRRNAKAEIRSEGRDLVLPLLTPEEAKAHLAKINGAN